MITGMKVDKSLYTLHWKKFLFWGFALVVLGMIAISTSILTTILTVFILGGIFTMAGTIVIMNAWSYRQITKTSFILHTLMGLCYITVGFMLINNPLQGSITLTFLLGAFYLFMGGFRTFYAMSHQGPRWMLSLLNGLVSFILGILILSNWPAASLYIIGLFVGIDLLFCGWVFIMSALAARNLKA